MEPETSQDEEPKLRETSSCEFWLSTNPKKACRFILLGGDELAKNDACRFMLRTLQPQPVQRSILGSCEMKESYVCGRHVRVVNSPFLWMDRLASSKLFSRTPKAIKNEMQNCVSLVYPGPHAFLLVIRVSTGKEHHLLKAIASVFGKKAIDYSMVLFVAGSDINSGQSQNANLKSLSMCNDRYHFLENTVESVRELFRKVEEMISKMESKFFIPSPYEKFTRVNFESWEKEIIDLLTKYKDKECEARTELDASLRRVGELKMELNAAQQRESQLMMKLDVSQQGEREQMKRLDASQQRERELRKELEASRQSESELRKELEASRQSESELRKELEASQQRQSEPMKDTSWRELESKQQELQASGAQLVRWDSKQQILTNFSSDQDEYLETE